MIISRTPFRISFFGGGTDYPEWYQEHGGAVISTTIAHYCYLNCRYLPQFFDYKNRIVWSKIETVRTLEEIAHPAVRAVLQRYRLEGVEIHHDGDLPSRSGLGSSSTFTVGLLNAVNALTGRMRTKMDLALEAIDIEKNMLRESVGVQDQIAAAFGGLNVISFSRNGQFEVSPMVVRSDRLEAFESNLMLFYTGISRFASEIAAKKISAIPSKTKTLKRMYEMVDEARLILASGDLDHFGSLLDEGWSLKKSISSVISNQQIDEIYERAKAAGAIGGKILGAGGGGFLLFYVPMERKGEVRQALSTLLEVPVKFERQGSQIIFYDPPPQ